MSPGCDEILNLLLWINETTWRRLKIHGAVKFNFKNFLFYSSKSKNDQKYEYFSLLWGTMAIACELISSEQHACGEASFYCLKDLNTYSVKYLIIFLIYCTSWSLIPPSAKCTLDCRLVGLWQSPRVRNYRRDMLNIPAS